MDVNRSAEVIPLPVARNGNTSAILNLVRDQVDGKIDYILSGFCESIADTLFDELVVTEDDDTKQSYFHIMRTMKVEQSTYTNRFNELISEVWSAFPEQLEQDTVRPIEDDIAQVVAPLCERVNTHYKIGIRETRHRFQSICQRFLETDPLNPDIYYRCFWHALGELDLSRDERQVVMSMFHRFVMDRYGQILQSANRTLIELQVPQLDQFPTSSQ